MRGPVVLADQVQAQVDARARAGAGGDVTVIREEPVRLHAHPRELPPQLLSPRPVRGVPKTSTAQPSSNVDCTGRTRTTTRCMTGKYPTVSGQTLSRRAAGRHRGSHAS